MLRIAAGPRAGVGAGGWDVRAAGGARGAGTERNRSPRSFHVGEPRVTTPGARHSSRGLLQKCGFFSWSRSPAPGSSGGGHGGVPGERGGESRPSPSSPSARPGGEPSPGGQGRGRARGTAKPGLPEQRLAQASPGDQLGCHVHAGSVSPGVRRCAVTKGSGPA